MKAEKVPIVRQSRVVLGLKKLNAKKMNSAELMTTSDQRPYAGASCMVVLPVMATTMSVAAVVQQVEERAGQEEQIGEDAEKMRAVLLPQQHDRHRTKGEENPAPGSQAVRDFVQ